MPIISVRYRDEKGRIIVKRIHEDIEKSQKEKKLNGKVNGYTKSNGTYVRGHVKQPKKKWGWDKPPWKK